MEKTIVERVRGEGISGSVYYNIIINNTVSSLKDLHYVENMCIVAVRQVIHRGCCHHR
jgi:hypothetical protein